MRFHSKDGVARRAFSFPAAERSACTSRGISGPSKRSSSTLRAPVPVIANGCAPRGTLDEKARNSLARVSVAGAGWKLEDLARVERIRNAQRLADRHTLQGRPFLLCGDARRRCARRIYRTDVAEQ